MYTEAYTSAKHPTEPSLNEDALVLHEGSLFAVIDGVTDKSGVRHGDRSSGQWAGRAIADALRAVVDEDLHLSASAQQILERVNLAVRARYVDFGIEAEVAADPNRRFAAQVAAAFTDGDRLRLLVVGDCGIRIDGREVLTDVHPADGIMARVRAEVFAALERADVVRERNLEVSRAYTVEGIGRFQAEHADVLNEKDFEALRVEVLANLPAHFDGLEPGLVRTAAEHGLRGLAANRNGEGVLAHGCIDGFTVSHVHVLERLTSFRELSVLELFSDGYFGVPERHGRVAHWEDHIARIEREDPAKVHTVLSTKGSSPGCFTDDRTVLVLRKEAPTDAAG